MSNQPSLYQEPISVLNLGPATLERVQTSGVKTVGQLVECAGNPLLRPGGVDIVALDEIRQRLVEHGLRLAGDHEPDRGISDARLAWIMIFLTFLFTAIDPCPVLLVVISTALGIGLGVGAVRFERGMGRYMGGLAVVLLSVLALVLIAERWGK